MKKIKNWLIRPIITVVLNEFLDVLIKRTEENHAYTDNRGMYAILILKGLRGEIETFINDKFK